jgi:predicted  nucleic acid-binding Zn-ribbon protein
VTPPAAEPKLATRDQWAPGDYEKAVAEIQSDRIALEHYSKALDHALEAIESAVGSLGDKIESFEKRLVQIRAEVEKYFAAD